MVQKIQMSNQVLIEDDSSVGVQEAASQSPLVGSRSPISSLRRPLSNSIPNNQEQAVAACAVRTRARRGRRQCNAPNSPSRWVPQHSGGSPRWSPHAARPRRRVHGTVRVRCAPGEGGASEIAARLAREEVRSATSRRGGVNRYAAIQRDALAGCLQPVRWFACSASDATDVRNGWIAHCRAPWSGLACMYPSVQPPTLMHRRQASRRGRSMSRHHVFLVRWCYTKLVRPLHVWWMRLLRLS